MKLLQRVLFATDFGDTAADAESVAVRLASVFRAEVLPLHVLENAAEFAQIYDCSQLEQHARRRLDEVACRLRAADVVVAEPLLDVGSPYARIMDQANLLNVNVVILGSGDRGEEVGSTAENVARHCNKPVWVVREGSPPTVDRILCPVDFSAHSRRALSAGIHLARNFGARLTVLHVVERPTAFATGASGKVVHPEKTHLQNQLSRLKETAAACDAHGVEAEYEVREGKAAVQIVAEADKLGADLVIMGSTGRTGLSRWFLGSVATKVLRYLPCSVITVKAEHPIRLELESEADAEANPTRHLETGTQMLEQGFAEEAVSEFHAHLASNPMSHEAYDRLATACARLGRVEEAQKYRQEAIAILRATEDRRIEADIRRQHPLWNA